MPILFIIVLIDLVGFGVIIPLLPFYAEQFRASPDVVTLVMAIYSLPSCSRRRCGAGSATASAAGRC